MFFKIDTLKNFCKFHGKTPVFESLFDKIASLHACDPIKNILQHRRFPVDIAKFLRTSFLKNNTSGGCSWRFAYSGTFLIEYG